MESSETSLKPVSPEAAASTGAEGDVVTTAAIEKTKPEGEEANTDTVEKDKSKEGEAKTDTVEEKRSEEEEAKTSTDVENKLEEEVMDTGTAEEIVPEVDKANTDTIEKNQPEGGEMEPDTVEDEEETNRKETGSTDKSMCEEKQATSHKMEESKQGEDDLNTDNTNKASRTDGDYEERTKNAPEILDTNDRIGNAEKPSNIEKNESVSSNRNEDNKTERQPCPDVTSGDDSLEQAEEPEPEPTEKNETDEKLKSSNIEMQSTSEEVLTDRTNIASSEIEEKSPASGNLESSTSEAEKADNSDHIEDKIGNQDASLESCESDVVEKEISQSNEAAGPPEEAAEAGEKSVNKSVNVEERSTLDSDVTCNAAVKESGEKKPDDKNSAISKDDILDSSRKSRLTVRDDTSSITKESSEKGNVTNEESLTVQPTVIEDKPEEEDQDESRAATGEKMDVDDNSAEGKTSAPEEPPADHDDNVQVMESADVDNECPDDAMEGATHHEEDDPLSSAASGRDVEGDSQQMDVDEPQDKPENTIMEIHEDLLGDEDVKDEIQAEEETQDSDKQEDGIVGTAASPGETPEDQSSKESEKTSSADKGDGSGTSEGKDADDKANDESSSNSKEDNLVGKGTDDDDVCIIPDAVPQMMRKKLKEITKRESTTSESSTDKQAKTGSEESSGDKEDIPISELWEARRDKRKSSKDVDVSTPRPQRQAARKAESQIKQVLAAAESYDQQVEEQEEIEVEEEKIVEKSTSIELTVVDQPSDVHPCQQCGLVTVCVSEMQSKGKTVHFCTVLCHKEFLEAERSGLSQPVVTDTAPPIPISTAPHIGLEVDRAFVRACAQCSTKVNANEDKVLIWEAMDFCNEDCLGKYQTTLGSHCANCKGSVKSASLGKYCVRFGSDIKQFCCAGCLEEFKKGLKACSYCQKDISADQEGFLAPVGNKGQFKDFCTSACMEKYEQMCSQVPAPTVRHECAVCNKMAVVRVEVLQDGRVHQLCSPPCFAAFKFVNAIDADQCDMCKKYFDKAKSENYSIFYDDAPHSFCCKTCMNVYVLANRTIVSCTWCKVKKYNFDMIKKGEVSGQAMMMCSLNCLKLYQVSVNAVSVISVKCDSCGSTMLAQYHLTMSDATLRNFCSYKCVTTFQNKFRGAVSSGKPDTPVPTGGPKRAIPRRAIPVVEPEPSSKGGALPVISSVTSLAPNGEPPNTASPATLLKVRARPRKVLLPKSDSLRTPESDQSPQADYSKQTTTSEAGKPKAHVIIRPPHPPQRQNCGVQVRPFMHNKGVSCRPQPCTKETQTDDELNKPAIIPIPVPIYIPAPMCMYSAPFPVPVPFPLPIPVPIFIPTTRNSTKGILKEIKRIQEKIPADPFEAELLMMAEMVAAEKKSEPSDSSGDEAEAVPEETSAGDAGNGLNENFSPDAVDTSNTFGEDMLQMALKLASTLDEPAVDFEAAVASSTIVPGTQTTSVQSDDEDSEPDDSESVESKTRSGRKRASRPLSRTHSATPTKRHRRVSSSESLPVLPPSDGTSSSTRSDVEKPDANKCLKFTYGVNAWRQWVLQKNAQLEKGATNHRKLKLFKTDLLQLTSDELNYSLCLFVKEVRKPNGSEYAPDTIYYLCLGIQLYLIENGRVDNIFSDPFYEKFTECLDEVAKKFSALYDDTQFIVTRVEEEHLWESKQLGAHSPHVLLSTLMFFNAKHFNIATVDEHMLLSFSHIMKHWKRNNNAPSSTKTPGRNVLLRFYPSQASLESNTKKKKVYEQSENEENPLRCPVKLYEFYLSKCPESVKTRNDVFYLQPERSCVPDSPVWYSTSSLGKDTLLKMLRRVKMVKEINEAILK